MMTAGFRTNYQVVLGLMAKNGLELENYTVSMTYPITSLLTPIPIYTFPSLFWTFRLLNFIHNLELSPFVRNQRIQ